jgi:hypothetical protein
LKVLPPVLKPVGFGTWEKEDLEAYRERLHLPEDEATLQFYRQVVYDHFKHFNDHYPDLNLGDYRIALKQMSAAEAQDQIRFFNNETMDRWGEQYDEFERRNQDYIIYREMAKHLTPPFPPVLIDPSRLADHGWRIYGRPLHLIEGTHRVSYLRRMLARGIIPAHSRHDFVLLSPHWAKGTKFVADGWATVDVLWSFDLDRVEEIVEVRRYQSVRQRVIDELGQEVCGCRDDETAQKIADALNRAEMSPAHRLGSLLVRPHRMEGVTVEWPMGSLLDEPTTAGDSLADLLAKGEEVKSELCERAGGTLSALEVAQHLQTSHETVDRLRREGKLLAVTMGQELRFPHCQFVGGLAMGVEEILAILSADEWTALEFMITSIPELGGETGLQAFASTDPDKRELARRVARIAAGEGTG